MLHCNEPKIYSISIRIYIYMHMNMFLTVADVKVLRCRRDEAFNPKAKVTKGLPKRSAM